MLHDTMAGFFLIIFPTSSALSPSPPCSQEATAWGPLLDSDRRAGHRNTASFTWSAEKTRHWYVSVSCRSPTGYLSVDLNDRMILSDGTVPPPRQLFGRSEAAAATVC